MAKGKMPVPPAPKGRAFDRIVSKMSGNGAPALAIGKKAAVAMPKLMGVGMPAMEPDGDEVPGAVRGMGAAAGPHPVHIHIHLPPATGGRRR